MNTGGWEELTVEDELLLFWPDLTLAALQEDLVKLMADQQQQQSSVALSPLPTPPDLEAVRQTLADAQFQACDLKFDALKVLLAAALCGAQLRLELPCDLSSSTVPVQGVLLREMRVDETQNRKDIHRDQVTVNGQFFRGADLGYDGLVDLLTKAAGGDREFAVRCVSLGCRTFSGGMSLQVVMDAFAYEDSYVVVPESLQARPVDFLASDDGAVLIRAHTRYSLRCASDAETVQGVVDAVFLCDARNSRAAVHLQVS